MSSELKTIPDYLNAWLEAIHQVDAQRLCNLLQPSSLASLLQFVPRPEAQLDYLCSNKLPAPFDEVAASTVRANVALGANKMLDAYTYHAQALNAFVKAFKEVESNQMLTVLHSLVRELRVLSIKADAELLKAGKQPEKVDDAGRVMMSCFSVCNNDRSPLEQNKKWGTLGVVNQLFRLYFQNNQLHMCKPLVRSIEMMQAFVRFEQLPIAHQVTFNFFVGRLALLDGDYPKAESLLEFCLTHCHKNATQNHRRILINLIPVKLLLGSSPSQELLDKYHLGQEFSNIVRAVREGSMALLHTALEQHEEFFIQNSVYLVLEKLTNVVYRNLFKRVADAVAPECKLNLQWFQDALRLQGSEDMELDEIECVLANLIHGGSIKGYISHQHRKLVVSKACGFPPLRR
eukprot:TRINITY_DN1143_c0_g1_i4.p1 TRINITY_DN1143_c0_g1~~TRINITY_DN1143_c0_g1_i4.p1  ORF type:complete len:403 (-),score=74.93 TRINITY_DN1143_c0_g1_i4:415-1623(-)